MFAESVLRAGIESALSVPSLYQALERFLGGDSCSRIVESYVRAQPGDRVLDIGCGPGDLLAHLPAVDYLGLDVSARYIEAARRRFRNRGRFVQTSVRNASLEQPATYDLVVAIGVLHHLEDSEAVDLFRLARQALKPEGRLVTIDGCYQEGQATLARWLLHLDRGKFVRTRAGYTALAAQVFPQVEAHLRHNLLRLPSTHLILECRL